LFLNGIIYDSGPVENIVNIDKAIFVSIIAISSVFLSFILRKKFYRENSYQIKKESFFEKNYLKFRKKVIFLFTILFCFVAFLNLYLNIYQKGFIYQH
jgi:ABC-type Fe3+ transport system permease subunit